MSQILVFSEKDEFALELLSKGREFASKLGMELTAAILGQGAGSKAGQYFNHGAIKVYISENSQLNEFDPEVYAQALSQIVEQHKVDVVLLTSTKSGREMAPRLAQRLNAGCIIDANNIEVKDGNLVAYRYALGGNTVASEYIKTARKVISVMPRAFERSEAKAGIGQLVPVDLKLVKSRIVVLERKEKGRELVDLEKAEILLCVGRGLRQKDDLAVIRRLADVIKGEIGCTKSLATDLAWLSEDRVVGLSGKRCKPKLAFSIGISGQSQHVVGIAGAKVIVAVNSDKNALIFKVADYGAVADLYKLVPLLAERIEKAVATKK